MYTFGACQRDVYELYKFYKIQAQAGIFDGVDALAACKRAQIYCAVQLALTLAGAYLSFYVANGPCEFSGESLVCNSSTLPSTANAAYQLVGGCKLQAKKSVQSSDDSLGMYH